MKEKFILLLKELNISANDQILTKFDIYYKTLIEWNKKMNLTAITDEDDVYLKHFYDSLCTVKAENCRNKTLLDVGSGAGFPSIPLKIVFPDIKVTIIDALSKRISFLTELCNKLDIDVTLIHGRAEEHSLRNHYDIVSARAVANLRVLAELCIPFVKKDGYFLSLKGPKIKAEIENAHNAIKVLGGSVEEIVTYFVGDEERSIAKISKVKDTQAMYPRQFSKIKKRPL